MTKAELYSTNLWISVAEHEKMIKLLDQFFEANVCIQRGTNRHKFADVLHAWIEGAEIEAPKTVFLELGYKTMPIAIKYLNGNEYSIKPKLLHEQWKSLYDQGIELEVNNNNINNSWFSLDSSALSFNDIAYQYRIKPKEPTYEYLWYKEDVETTWGTIKEWESFELLKWYQAAETKRERK